MITCRQARHLFDSYLDDELPSSLRAELHAHRLACPDCSHELALLEACADVVRTDPRDPMVRGDFTDRVLDAMRTRQPVKLYRWRRVALAVGSPLAAAAVLVFAVTAWFQPAPSRPTLIDSMSQKLPDSMIPSSAIDRLNAQARAELKQTKDVPAGEVLQAMLQGATVPANRAWSDARRSATELASLVRLGMIPTEPRYEPLTARAEPARDPGTLDDVDQPAPVPWIGTSPVDGATPEPPPVAPTLPKKIEI